MKKTLIGLVGSALLLTSLAPMALAHGLDVEGRGHINANRALDGNDESLADRTKGVFFGVVTVINGTNFTLQVKNKDNTTKDITVNASAAISAGLKVNDTVKVKGAFAVATNVLTATKITIGAAEKNHHGFSFRHWHR